MICRGERNMLNQLTILAWTMFLAVGGVAAAEREQPRAERQSCELMSREEMQLCLNTKPGDVSGARSVRCDELPRRTIESCVREKPESETAPPATASTGAGAGESQRR
jgi:hypothetical protein